MCKDSMNTSTYSSTTSIDLETLEGGAFDIIGCIDSVSGLSVGEDAKNVTTVVPAVYPFLRRRNLGETFSILTF